MRFRFLFITLVSALTLLATACGGTDDPAAPELRLTNSDETTLQSACRGWGFTDLAPEPGAPTRIQYIETSSTFSEAATFLRNYGDDTTHHYYSSEHSGLDLVGCFREVGRTKVDVECPLIVLGEPVDPAVYELDLEIYLVDVATGAEVGSVFITPTFDECPDSPSVVIEMPELYAEINQEAEDAIVALVQPFLDE